MRGLVARLTPWRGLGVQGDPRERLLLESSRESTGWVAGERGRERARANTARLSAVSGLWSKGAPLAPDIGSRREITTKKQERSGGCCGNPRALRCSRSFSPWLPRGSRDSSGAGAATESVGSRIERSKCGEKARDGEVRQCPQLSGLLCDCRAGPGLGGALLAV